jgi:RNA recognition motif-containing protein
MRWLVLRGNGSGVARFGAGRFGGAGNGQIPPAARFWSFGGAPAGGDDENDGNGEGGGKGDRGTAEGSSDGTNDAGGDAEAGTSQGNSGGIRIADRSSDKNYVPTSKSPKWNAPDDPVFEGADGVGAPRLTGADLTDLSSALVSKPPKNKPSAKPKPKKATTESTHKPAGSSRSQKTAEETSSASPSQPKNLYVKNLPRDFNAKKLAHLFLPHGDVQSTKFVLDAGPVPTGLVRFAKAEEAAAAMAALHGVTLSASDGGLEPDSESVSDSDSSDSSSVSDTPLAASPPLEISLAMTRGERDLARIQRAEERESRKQQRTERAERKKRFVTQVAGKTVTGSFGVVASVGVAGRGKKATETSPSFVGVSVKISHIPPGLDHKQLRAIFGGYGRLGRVKMMNPNGDNPSSLVTFESERVANIAAATLAGVTLPGSKAPLEFEAHHVSVKPVTKKTMARLTKKSYEARQRDGSSSSDGDSSSSSSDGDSSSSSSDSSSSESDRERETETIAVRETERIAVPAPSEHGESETETIAAPSSKPAPFAFALNSESVELTAEVWAKATAAKAAASRVWRDVQASRAVSNPEALANAKALNEAATKKFSELSVAKRAEERMKRRRDAGRVSGASAEGVAGGTTTRAVPLIRDPSREPSLRVRAYAERRKNGGSVTSLPQDRTTNPTRRAAIAGPGVDVGDAMGGEARSKLEAAALRSRSRGRDFAGMGDVRGGFGGRSGGGRGGGRGRGGGGGRGRGDARENRNSRRNRDGDGMDEKTRAALEARVREARDASSSDIPWEWDPATLEQGAKKTFLENFNVGEVRVFPNHLIPRTDCPYSYQKGLLPLTVCPYIAIYEIDTFFF